MKKQKIAAALAILALTCFNNATTFAAPTTNTKSHGGDDPANHDDGDDNGGDRPGHHRG
jgi:hypothetical protein